MDRPKRRELTPEEVQEALKLIKQQATEIRTVDRDDLEGELARRLILEVRRSRPNIGNWNAYVRGLLDKKAKNWIRDWRDPWQDRMVPQKSKEEDVPEDLMENFSNPHNLHALDEVEQKISLDQLVERLPRKPKLRRMCRLLGQRKWTDIELGKLLSVSRNTISRWRRKIRQIAKRHKW